MILALALSFVGSLSYGAVNTACDKYEAIYARVCGETSAETCRAKDRKNVELLVSGIKDLISPRPEILAAQNAFIAKTEVTQKDAEQFFATMADTCLQQNMKMFKVMINSGHGKEIGPLIREVANRGVDQQPTLLSVAIDLVIMDNAVDKGILKIDSAGTAELKRMRIDLKDARAKIETEIESAGGPGPENDPALAKKISQLELAESGRLRRQLKDWAVKNL